MKRLVLERTDGHHAYRRGVLILSGGKSSRMGQSKADLPWKQGTMLTDLLERARLAEPSDIVVSTNTPLDLRTLQGDLFESHPLSDRKGHKKLCERELASIEPDTTHCLQWVPPEGEPVTIFVVTDKGGSHGPLSGIVSGLEEGRSEVYLAVSIDMPFFENFDFATTSHMLDRLDEAPFDCVVPTLHGRIEPMGALYSKRCIEPIKALLKAEEYHVRALFERVKTEYIAVDDLALDYKNINTPLDYKVAQAKELNRGRKVPLISVCAKESKIGKTTISAALIKALTDKGFEMGYVKSDGHGFTMDREGSDTFQASQAGAKAVAISGPHSYAMLVKHNKKKDIASLAENLSVDLVVLETRSRGVLPIIEVVPNFKSITSSTDDKGENPITSVSPIAAEKITVSESATTFEKNVSSESPINEQDVIAVVSMSDEPLPVEKGLRTTRYFTKSQVTELANWLCEDVL
ncbi:MAG: molybdopterin-guanine dinucleotide biosynthesis protein MobB [Veillonella caviae]|nr:molybdopterin-guanine dinucleotide biosynthesis protein MobB [Veillonella caviae]